MKAQFIPADVPAHALERFKHNLSLLTHQTNRVFLFACDQKIEHLNTDFDETHADKQAQDPEHIFSIAHHSPIGALATHMGLISRYAKHYSRIPYVVKLNAKTNAYDTPNPFTVPLTSVADVVKFQQESNLTIVGVGITLYIGSMHEPEMLSFASQAIFQAHQAGLIAIVWAYARGVSITDDTSPSLAAGLTGLAASLGADFVKIKPPHATELSSTFHLQKAVTAAGNTGVLCSGGSRLEPHEFLQTLYAQLHEGNTAGCAVGRNIFQHSHTQAVALCNAIACLVYENKKLSDALTYL